jgi:3-isopropylmalate/(R)-2-methylmalate dehydratase small subunit
LGDLAAQTIEGEGLCIYFSIERYRREALMLGLDAIGITMEHADTIRRFQEGYFAARNWLTD